MNSPSDSKQLPKTLGKFILYFLKQYKGWAYGLFGFAMLSGSYGTINSYLMKTLIDGVAGSKSLEDELLRVALVPSILIILNYEVQNICWRAMNYIRARIAPSIRSEIIEKLFSYVQYHSYNYFQDNFSGSIASNINRVAENIENIIHHNALYILRCMTQFMFTLTVMYAVSPLFSVALLIWASLFLTISFKFAKKITFLSNSFAKAHSELYGKIIDSVSNSNNVRLFSREMFEVDFLKKYLRIFSEKFRNKDLFMLKVLWGQGLSITVLISIMVYILVKLKIHDLITVGDFALILGLVFYITESVWYVTDHIEKLNDAIGQCNQGLNMIATPHNVIDTPNASRLIIKQGEIKFENTSFSYPNNHKIFSNLSVTITGGQKVGLVGFSGSGKTTFAHLIIRLFDLTSGKIYIDGQDISAISQNSLRDNVGFISQDPILFHRSILDNIKYGKINADDEEVLLAAKESHAHEFITLAPGGYHALVGDKGMKLSGGQRQRLSIARAILKNSPILILDEATSALDSVTEIYIQDSLNKLMKGKTVIVIAHRLSTLLSLDRILVFDQGMIVEDGTHTELLAKNGIYSLLWKSQVGGFLPNNLNMTEMNIEKMHKIKSLSTINTEDRVV